MSVELRSAQYSGKGSLWWLGEGVSAWNITESLNTDIFGEAINFDHLFKQFCGGFHSGG